MKLTDKVKTLSDLVLLRCIITKDCGSYFKAKDYNGNKYLIAKNSASKKFKEGSDDTFYAYKEITGVLFKRELYHPVSSKDFLRLKEKLK